MGRVVQMYLHNWVPLWGGCHCVLPLMQWEHRFIWGPWRDTVRTQAWKQKTLFILFVSFQQPNQTPFAVEPRLTNSCTSVVGCSVSNSFTCRGSEVFQVDRLHWYFWSARLGFRYACCSVSVKISLQGQVVLFPWQFSPRWLMWN